MDPIRESRSLPPPAPVARGGGSRPDGSGVEGRGARGGGGAPAGGGGAGASDAPPEGRPVPRGAADEVARAAAAVEAARAEDPDAGASVGRNGGGAGADPTGPDAARAEALAARLAALGFDPNAGSAALETVAGRGAVPLRVALLAAAAELRAPAADGALTALTERLLQALPVAVDGAPEAARAAFAAALQSLAGATPAQLGLAVQGGVDAGALRALGVALLTAFQGALEAALRERPGPDAAARGALLGELARGDRAALAQRLEAPALAAVLALPADARLRQALVRAALGSVRPDAADPRLALLAELAEGEATRAERALASLVGALEGEAAANAARREAGEPTVWTLPVLDHGRWSTLTLLEDRHGRDARDRTGDEVGTRVAIGADFSALGPVRADLAVSKERVVLRFVVAEPETARRVRVAAPALRERLAAGGRAVLVAVSEGARDAARVDVPPPPLLDRLDLEG